VKVLLVALTAAVTVALVPGAQSAVRPGTTAPPEVVAVKITITDARVHMSPRRAQRGAVARFILVNTGKKPHTFALGHLRHGTGTQTGFVKSLKPNEQSILILFLDYRGKLPYLCTLPADRSKPGMKGTFTII
jgi:hypothetical protein